MIDSDVGGGGGGIRTHGGRRKEVGILLLRESRRMSLR